MDWRIFGRGRMWLDLLLGAAMLASLAVGIFMLRGGGDPGVEPTAKTGAEADAPLRPAASGPEKAEPELSRAITARRAFIRDCARPTRARRRIQMDHLFEMGCIGQLSAALGARVRDGAPAEARTLWDRHRADVDSVEQGGWISSGQPRRVREAMLSATELMKKLAAASEDSAELEKEVAAARKAARSLRDGVPLAEQTERTDEFFRRAAEALRLLGEREE